MRESSRASILVVIALAACSKSSSVASGGAPAGLSCSSTTDGGATAASLTAALGSAAAGSCVLVTTATYTGSFQVPAGVTLASENGQQATFTGGTSTEPVIAIAGGAGSGLWNVDVTGAAGVGVAVRNGAATISNVTVTGAKSAAFAALCSGASCLTTAGQIVIDSSTFVQSELGIWVSGALVSMTGGGCTDESTTSLSGGMGVVVLAGGRVELTNVDVERNSGVGVLIDGAGGTTALIQSSTVSNNLDRGVWAQNLTGTMDNPALSMNATQIENNKIVGLGAVGSTGIIIVGGDIKLTADAPVVTTLGETDQIGDGAGFFGGSADIKLTNVAITDNARADGLIDHNIGAIIIVGGDVVGGSADLLVVVQDSQDMQDVQVPTADLSSVKTPLSVSAPTIPLATVLQ